MCRLCDEGKPQDHAGPATRFTARFPEGFSGDRAPPQVSSCSHARGARRTTTTRRRGRGKPGRRYVIRGGAVMSMDPSVGDFARPTSWSRARRSSPSGRTCTPAAATRSTPRGRIVMPGFIDTHHHQFETALRSFLADGVLINDGSGSASGSTTYFEFILLKFAPVYRPAGRLHQRAVRRPVPARRRRHHGARRLADPSLAAALGRRHPGAVRHRAPRRLRLFRERGRQFSAPIPATSIRRRGPHQEAVVLVDDQLVHMIMGGEVYLGDATTTRPGRSGASSGCRSRRTSSRRSASVRPWTLAAGQGGGSGTHRDRARQPVHPHDRHVGPGVAGGPGRRRTGLDRLPDRDEHASRHAADHEDADSSGMEPSLSVDVECTLTADFFTQMRSA